MHANFVTVEYHFLQIRDYLLGFVEEFTVSDILDYPAFEKYSILFAESLYSATTDRVRFLFTLQV